MADEAKLAEERRASLEISCLTSALDWKKTRSLVEGRLRDLVVVYRLWSIRAINAPTTWHPSPCEPQVKGAVTSASTGA